jgi:hypothetical protein
MGKNIDRFAIGQNVYEIQYDTDSGEGNYHAYDVTDLLESPETDNRDALVHHVGAAHTVADARSLCYADLQQRL